MSLSAIFIFLKYYDFSREVGTYLDSGIYYRT